MLGIGKAKWMGWGLGVPDVEYLWFINKEEAVPRKPFNEGGRKTPDNCVLFCPECYSKIKEPGKTEIPFNTIPYYNSVPPEWWRE